MADNPYSSLPDHRFWRKAVASLPPFALDPIVATPFKISPRDKVATAGSCFAQEIAHRLQQSGYHYYLPERPPEGMSAAEAERRNYSMYSCRYGNLYTTTQLLQLIQRAYGDFTPDLDVWTTDDGRVVDPFRPRIEPDGYANAEEMRADRVRHFAAVREMIETMDVFVFTFGLTECWRHKSDGAVLQLAPGVAGGDYDPRSYEFWNMTVGEVVRDFLASADLIHGENPERAHDSLRLPGVDHRDQRRPACARLQLRLQGYSSRGGGRGRAFAREHRLFSVLRSRDGGAQRRAFLRRRHAQNQFLRYRPHDENVLRSFHVAARGPARRRSGASNSMSRRRPKATQGSSATKRRSKSA